MAMRQEDGAMARCKVAELGCVAELAVILVPLARRRRDGVMHRQRERPAAVTPGHDGLRAGELRGPDAPVGHERRGGDGGGEAEQVGGRQPHEEGVGRSFAVVGLLAVAQHLFELPGK